MATDLTLNRRGLALSLAAFGTTLALTGRAAAQTASLSWAPTALTPTQAKTLDVAAELIMPATDTPGAREAGVPQFVDRAVGISLTPIEAKAVRGILDRMETDAQSAHGAAFAALKPDQQTALLTGYDAEVGQPQPVTVGRGDTETGLSNKSATPAPRVVTPPFQVLKDLVTVGYFTSQLGATKAVRWDPFPGAYRGCVPLSLIGRAWAT